MTAIRAISKVGAIRTVRGEILQEDKICSVNSSNRWGWRWRGAILAIADLLTIK